MFNLTPAEKRAIMILVLVTCSAGIVQLFKPLMVRSQFYDYSSADSIFQRISKNSLKPDTDSIILNNNREKKSNRGITLFSPVPFKKNKQLPAPGTIDLNRASITELELLPHIGTAMAKRIVTFRKNHGPFKSVRDLKKVKGIGDKTIKSLTPYLKVVQ
jgi:competence ComEA-like helix-hairpin-helix protein